MHRAISHDSSAGSAPSTPGSAEASGPGYSQSHRHTMWRESRMHAKSVDSDSSQDGPCEKRLRSITSEGDISNSGFENEARIPTEDVDCSLVQKLEPRTKFDDLDAVVMGLTFKNNGDLIVSDAANHKVKSFDVRTGQLKIECSVGSKQATLGQPRGVTVLKTAQILVADA